jgi:hypothetical protein
MRNRPLEYAAVVIRNAPARATIAGFAAVRCSTPRFSLFAPSFGQSGVLPALLLDGTNHIAGLQKDGASQYSRVNVLNSNYQRP